MNTETENTGKNALETRLAIAMSNMLAWRMFAVTLTSELETKGMQEHVVAAIETSLESFEFSIDLMADNFPLAPVLINLDKPAAQRAYENLLRAYLEQLNDS